MIDINNESEMTLDERSLIDLAKFALHKLRIHPQAELSILLVEPAVMESYHVKFMDLPGPTDVMSFPMDELRVPKDNEDPPEGLLGDIVLCPKVLAEQAPNNKRSIDEEAQYLLVHGLLHLLGYDHVTPKEESEMFHLTDKLILAWEKSR